MFNIFSKFKKFINSIFTKEGKVVEVKQPTGLPTQEEIEKKRQEYKELQKKVYTHKSTKEKAKLKRHTPSKDDINKYDDSIIREYVSQLYIRRVPQEQLMQQTKNRLGCYVSGYDIKKHCVAQIRHNYSNYERLCNYSRKDLTKEDSDIIHDILKYETMILINRFYELDVITKEIIKTEGLEDKVKKFFKEGVC